MLNFQRIYAILSLGYVEAVIHPKILKFQQIYAILSLGYVNFQQLIGFFHFVHGCIELIFFFFFFFYYLSDMKSSSD